MTSRIGKLTPRDLAGMQLYMQFNQPCIEEEPKAKSDVVETPETTSRVSEVTNEFDPGHEHYELGQYDGADEQCKSTSNSPLLREMLMSSR